MLQLLDMALQDIYVVRHKCKIHSPFHAHLPCATAQWAEIELVPRWLRPNPPDKVYPRLVFHRSRFDE